MRTTSLPSLAVLSLAVFSLSTPFLQTANATPPPGPIDPVIHAWFEGLVRPDGMPCCGQADCRVAKADEIRADGDTFEVKMNDAWETVPDSYVVHREDNPIAATIICRTHWNRIEAESNQIYCVIPYAGL